MAQDSVEADCQCDDVGPFSGAGSVVRDQIVH